MAAVGSVERRMKLPITLIVSIDTEEDNWAPARTGITVENIRELPRLDRWFERLGVRATYFTSFQVAIQPWAASILRHIASRDRAEVGAHLHPWNTPPLEEPLVARNTVMRNLPQRLQEAKIRTLTDMLVAGVGRRPAVFRAGRWGFGTSTAAALLACGYRIDSSVTPFVSWRAYDDGPSHIGAPLEMYRLDECGDPRVPVPGGPLVEVPTSCGYSRNPPWFWGRLHGVLEHSALRRLRLVGIASRLGLVRRIALSPETDSVADMFTLSRRLIEHGVRHLHLTWHSPSLRPGLSPFVATRAHVARLYATVESYLERLAVLATVTFATLSEAVRMLVPDA